jgi:hypothetical protein
MWKLKGNSSILANCSVILFHGYNFCVGTIYYLKIIYLSIKYTYLDSYLMGELLNGYMFLKRLITWDIDWYLFFALFGSIA